MNIQEIIEFLSSNPDVQSGLGMNMILVFEGMNEPAKGTVVNIEPLKSLALRVPEIEGPAAEFPAGRKATLIYARKGVLHSFGSEVLEFQETPEPVITMHYPDFIDMRGRRKYKRVSTNFPARCDINGHQIDGVITNLSIGGCRFTSRSAWLAKLGEIKRQDRLRLTIKAFGKTILETISGRIAHIDFEERKAGLGVEFLETPDEISREIKDYVKSVAFFEKEDDNLVNTLHM